MTDENKTAISESDVLRMTVEIVSAYVTNNSVAAGQVPEIINTVHASLATLNGQTGKSASEPLKPAISIRRSVTPDFIICLEDGKKLKMLKRHLRAAYGMTPDEYRTKWGLGPDYPMVAPNYAKQRSTFAKQIGLGRKRGQKVPRRNKT